MKKINVQGLASKLNRVVLVTAVTVVALAGKRASAQIVDNGYFQDNASSFSSYAGGAYGYYGNGTIEGFAGTAAGGEGLNGYDIHYNGGTETQFAPSGYAGSLNSMSDPLDFAYIQNSGYSLTQTLQNLNPLSIYKVTFLVGERSTDTDNVGTVSVTSNGSLASTSGSDSVTGQYEFTKGSFMFQTGVSATGFVLSLSNTTPLSVPITYPQQPSQDRDVDFADVVITQVGVLGYTPEPSTYAMLGLGILGLSLVARRSALKT